ncbi:MAG: zf-HC2 domain-containing protein [Pyrinomonadaceae bacterium]
MIKDFDKEIDILLRQTARRGETVSEIAGSHPDADEINAFAEHVLPEKARLRTVNHLAACARCRNILSNLMNFNTETSSEIISESKLESALIPWYKRLFVFPQIAYTMGLTILIFAGIIAIVVLKNSTRDNSSEVARVDEKPQIVNSVFNGANANSASSNSAMNSAAYTNSNATAAKVLPNSQNKNNSRALSANSNAAARDKNVEPAKSAPKTTEPSSESESAKKEKQEMVAAAPPRENNYTVNGTTNDSARRQAEFPQNSASQNQSSDTAAASDTRGVQSPAINGRNTQSLRVSKNRAETKADNSSDADENKAAETRSVGGKNFRRAGGIWYDVKYKGQKTINVTRGSNDYKKLDGGLRSIADNLSGIVVIIWKDKVYRIQ